MQVCLNELPKEEQADIQTLLKVIHKNLPYLPAEYVVSIARQGGKIYLGETTEY